MRYTFSDDEDDTSDAISTRRSTRQSGISTPAEPAGPTFTASGRQVKARQGGAYGESMLSGQRKTGSSPADAGTNSRAALSDVDSEPITSVRPQRSTRGVTKDRSNGWRKGDDHIEDYNSVDEMDDESEAASSGDNWDGDDDDNQDFAEDEEEDEGDEEMSQSDEELEVGEKNKHLVVQLRYRKGDSKSRSATASRKNSSQGGTTIADADPKAHPKMPIPMDMNMGDACSVSTLPPAMGVNGFSSQGKSDTPIVSHAHPEPELLHGANSTKTNGAFPPGFSHPLNSHPVNDSQM
jgi:hypothetical protein